VGRQTSGQLVLQMLSHSFSVEGRGAKSGPCWGPHNPRGARTSSAPSPTPASAKTTLAGDADAVWSCGKFRSAFPTTISKVEFSHTHSLSLSLYPGAAVACFMKPASSGDINKANQPLYCRGEEEIQSADWRLLQQAPVNRC